MSLIALCMPTTIQEPSLIHQMLVCFQCARHHAEGLKYKVKQNIILVPI